MSDGGWRYSWTGIGEYVEFPVRRGHCCSRSRGVSLFRGFDAFVSILPTSSVKFRVGAMSNKEEQQKIAEQTEDDDEPDEWFVESRC
jgi:hypothetical protein